MDSETVVTPLDALEDPADAQTPEPEPPPQQTPPSPQDQPPGEDATGLRAALLAERRRRQDLEEENASLRQPPPKPLPPEAETVNDDEAERYARHYELYTKDGLDIGRAKRIIADNRSEMKRVAKQAADEAVGPVQEQTAKSGAREQFVRVAMAVDGQGQRVLDDDGVKILAQKFAQMPPQLASLPEVADLMLNAAIGETVRTGKKRVAAPSKEPVFSESPGGQRGTGYTISNIEKKVADSRGISHGDWEKAAKTYQPGQPNRLE
jgi:hypothetical protein